MWEIAFAIVCDLVSENKKSSVLTMTAVMNTYKHSAERVTGRNRSHTTEVLALPKPRKWHYGILIFGE